MVALIQHTHMSEANLIVDKDFLTYEQKNFVKDVILGDDFQWYLAPGAIEWGDNYFYMFHVVLRRPELHLRGEYRFNSPYSDFFLQVFETFCDKNNIEYSDLLRISVNLVFPNGVEESMIHYDHDFPHRQLIVYLTDNPDSSTRIFDKDEETLLHEITPEQFKGVAFDAFPHLVVNQKLGIRVAVIYTFI